MKALVYAAPNQVRIEERPHPALHEGEVVLRIDAVGICGSDMHAYHGHDPRRKPGLVLGHEFAGVVVEGAGAGRRVTGNPLITCGACDYCLQGRTNLCTDRTMVGMTRPGAFAEYMSIPARCLIDLPPGLQAESAALAEPAATALHAVDLAARALVRPLPEVRALVIGGGAVGMFAALLLRSYGLRRLSVAETNALRRQSVARHVHCEVFDPLVADPVGEDTCELVIDAVGAKSTRQAALRAVRPGGVVMHIGLQDWASEIDMRKLTLSEITLIGTYTYTQSDLRATVAALDNGVFGDLSWVERRPMERGAEAFADLHAGRTPAAKIVLRPHG